MKKILLLPLLAVLFLGGCQNESLKKTNEKDDFQTILVATTGNVKPFDYEEDGQLTGYDIAVLKAVDEKLLEYKLKFQRTSWESLFPGLDSGRYQAAANNLSYTKERADKYLYSVPIARNPLVLVSRKSSSITSLDDIGGKKTQDDTGTSTAKLITDWNQKHSDNPSKIEYSGEDISKRLLDLENGEFDYLIFDKISVDTNLRNKGYDLTTVELEGNPLNYIIFAQENKDFQEKFNQTVETLYQNGSLEKLSQQFLAGSYLPNQEERYKTESQ